MDESSLAAAVQEIWARDQRYRPEAYYFVLDAPTMVTLSTCINTCIDTLLYARSVCTDATTQRACVDDSCQATNSCYRMSERVQGTLSAMLPAGVHYVLVDQYSPAPPTLPCGTFTLTPTGVPP